MSYLDNLENNLKALEKQDERDPEKVKREQERREAERDGRPVSGRPMPTP